MWTVYMHTCPNGKRYVGITSKKPSYRWGSGHGYQKQYFYEAIQEFGWKNITHEIIAKVDTLEEAAEIETNLIEKYQTYDKRYGYNVSKETVGFYGMPKSKHSDETRKLQSESAKARPMETRNLSGLLEHPYRNVKGVTHNLSIEGRRKMKSALGKPVIQYEVKLVPVAVYDIALTAKETTGINVYNSLQHGHKSGGYLWKYISDLDAKEAIDALDREMPYYYYGEDGTINMSLDQSGDIIKQTIKENDTNE